MPHTDHTPPALKKFIRLVERTIIKTLIVLMSILLILATIELAYVLAISVYNSSDEHLVFNLGNLMNIFGVVLLVVIGIELLDTIKVYFRKHVIHVEVVMLVAIIAIARKVIVMDIEDHSGIDFLGIAGIMIALAGGYYLIKAGGGCGFAEDEEKSETEDVVFQERVKKGDDEIIERKKTIKTQSEENVSRPGQTGQQNYKMGNQDDNSSKSE